MLQELFEGGNRAGDARWQQYRDLVLAGLFVGAFRPAYAFRRRFYKDESGDVSRFFEEAGAVIDIFWWSPKLVYLKRALKTRQTFQQLFLADYFNDDLLYKYIANQYQVLAEDLRYVITWYKRNQSKQFGLITKKGQTVPFVVKNEFDKNYEIPKYPQPNKVTQFFNDFQKYARKLTFSANYRYLAEIYTDREDLVADLVVWACLGGMLVDYRPDNEILAYGQRIIKNAICDKAKYYTTLSRQKQFVIKTKIFERYETKEVFVKTDQCHACDHCICQGDGNRCDGVNLFCKLYRKEFMLANQTTKPTWCSGFSSGYKEMVRVRNPLPEEYAYLGVLLLIGIDTESIEVVQNRPMRTVDIDALVPDRNHDLVCSLSEQSCRQFELCQTLKSMTLLDNEEKFLSTIFFDSIDPEFEVYLLQHKIKDTRLARFEAAKSFYAIEWDELLAYLNEAINQPQHSFDVAPSSDLHAACL